MAVGLEDMDDGAEDQFGRRCGLVGVGDKAGERLKDRGGKNPRVVVLIYAILMAG